MKVPLKIYRYRPMSEEVAERELRALQDSYLYSAAFRDMNDPMEAFLDLSRDQSQLFLPRIMQEVEDKLLPFIKEQIGDLALISFSRTQYDLPLWAYYASNFSGVCLEFIPEKLQIGDLQGEQLRPVRYSKNALPPLPPLDLLVD